MRLALTPLLALAVLLASALPAAAELRAEEITYSHGDTELVGYLTYDDAWEGERPGILVVHEWWGLNHYAKTRARQLAQMGYTAFACDMYGGGQSTMDRDQAGKWAGAIRGDIPLMRERAALGLEQLYKHKTVDPSRLGAIGFCFGGGVILNMAMDGQPLNAIAPFHGSWVAPQEGDDLTQFSGRALILHGSQDKVIDNPEFDAFAQRLDDAGWDWQLMLYGGAVHAFTNPDAGDDPSTGAAYDEDAANRSWNLMRLFFQDVFEGEHQAMIQPPPT